METRDPWELEHEGEQPPKLEFKPKARLVLEGSDRHDWGIVKDCHGSVNVIPEDAEVVGRWDKYGEGIFWVELLTPLSALEDKAIQLYADLAKSREESMQRMGMTGPVRRVPKTPRAPREPKAEAKPKDDTYDKLRLMLGGK